MPTRPNPKKLNPLQCRTLAILQQCARTPGFAESPDEAGGVLLLGMPRPHGDHFHLGDALIHARDATGLRNASVLNAMVRKGLVRVHPSGRPVLTPEGLAYDTGVAAQILHRADH